MKITVDENKDIKMKEEDERPSRKEDHRQNKDDF